MAFHLTATDIACASFVVGALGIGLSSYAVFIKRPKIKIEEAILYSYGYPEDWKNKTVEDIGTSSFMRFEVELQAANYRGEAGSLTKPALLIKASGKVIKVVPQHKHTESEKDPDNPNITTYWEVRHGKAYTLEPYGRADDKLKYYLSGRPDDIKFIIEHSQDIKYALQYRNHKGKTVEYGITDVVDKD